MTIQLKPEQEKFIQEKIATRSQVGWAMPTLQIFKIIVIVFVYLLIRAKCKAVANFPNMEKSYSKLSPGLRGFIVEDYIVFYYPILRWD
jgi:hypothetical protein